jgi:hypothetical protein
LNTEVIAINQDITPQGFPTVPGDSSVWSRNLSDGSIAVALCVAICSLFWMLQMEDIFLSKESPLSI